MERVYKAIGKDIEQKLKEKKVSKYHIHTSLNICSQNTLTVILKGESKNSYPFDKVKNIYKALGEKEINISSKDFKLYVRF